MWVDAIRRWVSVLVCRLRRAHAFELTADASSMWLQCPTCRQRTPGWQIDLMLPAPTVLRRRLGLSRSKWLTSRPLRVMRGSGLSSAR